MMKKTIVAVSMAALLMGVLVLSTPRKMLAGVVATLIRDQDNPGRHPFTGTCSAHDTMCTISIPQGEEVVIQNVAMNAGIPNTTALFYVQATGGGTTGVPVQTLGTDGATITNNYYTSAVSQPTWFTADPGTAVTCQVAFSGYVPFYSTSCTITGYYVTLP